MELGAQLDRTNADFFATQDIRRTQATAAENRLTTRVAGEETRGTIRTQGQEDRALTATTGLEFPTAVHAPMAAGNAKPIDPK